MFNRILVATDASEAGRNALAYAGQLGRTFDVPVQTCVVEEPRRVTRVAREHQLVQQIADEAGRAEADVIVLGLERRRIGHHALSRGVRQQLVERAHVSVLVPPVEPMARAATVSTTPTRHLLSAGRRRLQHV